MSDMKCPFCGKEMLCGGTLCRFDPDCPIHDTPVPTEVLELLAHTRKALDVAKDALKNIGTSYPRITDIAMQDKANKALEQITALEQKDVK